MIDKANIALALSDYRTVLVLICMAFAAAGLWSIWYEKRRAARRSAWNRCRGR